MTSRKSILGYFAAAMPTTGDGVVFATVLRGRPGRLSDDELPAAVVIRGDETVDEDHRGRGWSARAMRVEVQVLAKESADLDDDMDDYIEAVEQAVLYDDDLAGSVSAVLPAGSSAIEYDDESEQDVASAIVSFDVYYSHWPAEPV